MRDFQLQRHEGVEVVLDDGLVLVVLFKTQQKDEHFGFNCISHKQQIGFRVIGCCVNK